MSIVPMSGLSKCEVAMLGNNLSAEKRHPGRRHRLRAVNRSLAAVGEEVAKLYPAFGAANWIRQSGRRSGS